METPEHVNKGITTLRGLQSVPPSRLTTFQMRLINTAEAPLLSKHTTSLKQSTGLKNEKVSETAVRGRLRGRPRDTEGPQRQYPHHTSHHHWNHACLKVAGWSQLVRFKLQGALAATEALDTEVEWALYLTVLAERPKLMEDLPTRTPPLKCRNAL
eukprot:1144233-Pelagomonas_calceolata.AAC.2